MKKSIVYIALLLAVALIAAVYFTFDPSTTRFMPRCLFHELTGWQCPGCGSQRMLHALFHGNLREAWNYNAFLLCIIPLLIPMVWLEINRNKYPSLYMRVHSLPVTLAAVGAIIAWWILRNLES